MQVNWLKLLLTDDMGVSVRGVTLYCENLTKCGLANDPITSDRTKHIDIKH